MAGCSWIAVISLLTGLNQIPPVPVQVRVGIVAYEDFHREFAQFERLFSQLSRSDPSFRFQVALGSYGEVLQWFERQRIDVAIFTPGVFAATLPADPQQASPDCRYLATIQLPAARSAWASSARREAAFSDTYESLCLVAQDSPLNSVGDLSAAANRGEVEFLFVHRLSVSGRIAPLEALRRIGIEPPAEQCRFTYSHTASIRMLKANADGKYRVAFVWDDAAGKDLSLEDGVRVLPFPELRQLRIPHDVIAARSEFTEANRLQRLLLNFSDEDYPYRFAVLDGWPQRYCEIRDWLETAGAVKTSGGHERVSLDDIGQLLLLYARSQPKPPRLALVLSGGGAKCSYQVGAVAAIEEKLAKLRRDNPDCDLDIGLVVGTSGGAINSVPVALGITRTKEGRESLRKTWTQLDQRDIVRPPLLVRGNMGLWFALLQTGLIVWLVRWFEPRQERRGWKFAVIYTALAGLEILMGYLPAFPLHWLGSNHIVHHVWLWLSFGVRTSAWSLFVIGLFAMGLEAARARRGRHLTIPFWFTKATLATGLLGLPLLQLLTILGIEETLSGAQGMEQALAVRFPRLIDEHLSRNGQAKLEIGLNQPARQCLQETSQQIVERRLLRRDLVITGSCIAQTSEQLPSDLYFFAAAETHAPAPPYGSRGISLADHREILLDVVMGSGSIFPVFPARKIEGIPRAGQWIELVDGGFAHNSPVEAAVLWGATHVVLVEATPRTRNERGNFFKNATSSLRYLHQQAQLLDARSRGKVFVFSLSPDPPHMCVLDFADNLIADGIERGYRDASLDAGTSTPRFQRELGEPVFVEVLPAQESTTQ